MNKKAKREILKCTPGTKLTISGNKGPETFSLDCVEILRTAWDKPVPIMPEFSVARPETVKRFGIRIYLLAPSSRRSQ